jgi:phytoene dehydrogenase-like protein
MESLAAAHVSARAGRLPHEPGIEFTLPTACDPALAPMGQHMLSATVRPVPVSPDGGWDSLKPKLLERFYAALAPYAPDLARHVTRAEIATPEDFLDRYGHEDERSGVTHILAGWRARIETPIRGLMLCGAAAEPVPCVSGRAGRIAAGMILQEAKR